MTDDPYRLAGTDHARRMLRESETALWDVLAALNLMKRRLAADEEMPPAEMQKALLALGTTRRRLLDEVRNHERQIFFEHGLIDDAPLDFDAIRRLILVDTRQKREEEPWTKRSRALINPLSCQPKMADVSLAPLS
jgi:hypothetical protein